MTAPITLHKLRQVIESAYESGYHGCLDLKESYSEEALQALLAGACEPILNKNDGWKIFRVRELREVAVGTIFEHSIRGKGWIETNHMETVMRWQDGSASKFYDEDTPWTEPMRITGMTQKKNVKVQPSRTARKRATLGGLLGN
jgi:hypothetical protein